MYETMTVHIAQVMLAAGLMLFAWVRRELMDREDGEIVDLVRSGDVDAYGVLVTRYQRRLYHVVRRMVGRHEDADDIAQEAFVKAFEALERFDTSRSFYTWLCRIGMNAAINLSDKYKRRATDSLDERYEATGFEPPVDADASARAERKELKGAIERAVRVLPEGMRQVFVLRTFDELSYDEIAETLGIARGTVMSRLSRARERVQASLAEFLDPEDLPGDAE